MYNNFKAAPNLGNRGKINEFFFPIKDGHSSCFWNSLRFSNSSCSIHLSGNRYFAHWLPLCSNQICRSCVLFWNIWVHSHFIVSSCTSSARFAVNCFVDCCLFSWPHVIKKILCWARLLAVGNMGCRNNGLSE
jgi:hypothetical protein